MVNEKILIADDDEIVRKAFAETLSSGGYDVTSVSNGEEAIELLKKSHYDLLLTDYELGDVKGIDVLKAAKEINTDYKVIMITAYGDYALAKEATNSWKDKNSLVLYKTMGVDNLLSNVRDMLDGKKMDLI